MTYIVGVIGGIVIGIGIALAVVSTIKPRLPWW
jgi:hypothetical protein